MLGGARSGKSRYAEALVEAQPGPCIYIATAQARDAEMSERIRRHRERRGPRWETLEAPIDLIGALDRAARPDGAVLIDCLTLWLSNLLATRRNIEAETAKLVAALQAVAGPVVLVSNEVGLGVIPDNSLARSFLDHAGRLHQALAGAAQSVVFMAAGLPLDLKSPD